jgi:hypothetical protein
LLLVRIGGRGLRDATGASDSPSTGFSQRLFHAAAIPAFANLLDATAVVGAASAITIDSRLTYKTSIGCSRGIIFNERTFPPVAAYPKMGKHVGDAGKNTSEAHRGLVVRGVGS